MNAADRRECEAGMTAWYAETWYPKPDSADRCSGDAQLEYLHEKAQWCRRGPDRYGTTGKARWTMIMRCLVIVRTR